MNTRDGNNFGLNDSLKYYEFELDSLDNSGSYNSSASPTDWPMFLIGGKSPLSNIAAIKIIEVQIPFSWYVFNSGNNTFTLTEISGGTATATVTLPIGNYTSTQLAANLAAALIAASPNSSTYTVTFNVATQKFVITNTTGGAVTAFSFTFGLPTNSGNVNPRLYIGFPGGVTSSTALVITSPNVVEASGPNYIYVNSVRIGQMTNLYLPKGAFNLGGGNAGPQMAKVPVTVQPGGIIYWQDPGKQKKKVY